MSGVMYYPYRECKECGLFDWDNSDLVTSGDRCEGYGTEDCPGVHAYDCFDHDEECDCVETTT